MANEVACELFGFGDDALVGVHLGDLLTLKADAAPPVADCHLAATGEIVEVTGRVVSRRLGDVVMRRAGAAPNIVGIDIGVILVSRHHTVSVSDFRDIEVLAGDS